MYPQHRPWLGFTKMLLLYFGAVLFLVVLHKEVCNAGHAQVASKLILDLYQDIFPTLPSGMNQVMILSVLASSGGGRTTDIGGGGAPEPDEEEAANQVV